jgi:alpha-N-arabinofuranosidase
MSDPLGKLQSEMLTIDPKPQFDLSPYLFMQFMEPLGTTDGSVEAGWDFERLCWREDLIEVTRELAPTLVRWPGGCLSSYYRWKDAVGPRDHRKPMMNLCWGGMETDQVGTHEFIDFCRQVGGDPLIAVNFESDGRGQWAHPLRGGTRSAGPEEAAEWVDYCNNPSNSQRRLHGAAKPFDVRIWQIGNETSYDPHGYDREIAAKRTLAFARAMHKVDPDIDLIGWGDSGWGRRMLEVAGGELQYIAFHHHFGSGLDGSPLQGIEYRDAPELAWYHLMHAYQSTQDRIQRMREEVAGSRVSLALTESHFALPGRNRCEVLSTWAAGVANARILNVHARHGDILKIATLADFCGTRWMVNAIMIPTPVRHGRAFMMPVARVMALFGRHVGVKAIDVMSAPEGLDVTASRTGNRIFLHAVNTQRDRAVEAELNLKGMTVTSGRALEIADDPFREIDETAPDLFSPRERAFHAQSKWSFPAASVTVIELDVEDDPCRRLA